MTNFINYALLVAIFCLTPAGVVWLCRKIPLLGKLGPIMILYALGIVIGNLPFTPSQIGVLQEFIPNITIPLAIPMMLFGCVFSSSEAKLQLKVIISGIGSVAIAVVVGYLLFGEHVAEGDKIGGIMTGMYTGGMLNAAALQAIFRVESETYLLVNSYDIVISFLYLVFLVSVGIPLFRRLYGERHTNTSSADGSAQEQISEGEAQNTYSRLWTKEGARQMGKLLAATLVIVAISAGVALLLPEEWFMVVFILLLSTLGVGASFIRPIRALDMGYDIGMYLIYIFSITIASMADFSNIDIMGGLNIIGYLAVAVFLSLLLHAVLCRLMKVDADSMVVSSVAFINSPPFVPMISAAMQNRRALVTGLGAGIVGYAAGNHLGVLMATLLAAI